MSSIVNKTDDELLQLLAALSHARKTDVEGARFWQIDRIIKMVLDELESRLSEKPTTPIPS